MQADPSVLLLRPFLRAGRWVILLAIAGALASGHRHLGDPAIRAGLGGGLILYTLITLWLLRGPTLRTLHVVGVVTADVLIIATLVEASGGVRSPFFGFYYLVVVAAAIFYGITGGMVATVGILAITAIGEGSGLHGTIPPSPDLMIAKLPELPLMAIIAGYLATQLRREFERRHATEREALVLQVRDESIAREMALAREVQQAALPGAPPQLAGLEVAARFRSAAEVGGDFFDFYERNGRLGLLVGDAAGKGVAAALVATTAMHTFHNQAPRVGLVGWCEEFSQELEERAPDAMLATAFVCEIDAEGRVAWVNAGHPPPVLCRTGEPAHLLEGYDIAMGVCAGVSYRERELMLRPGDVLVIYTDGLSEAPRPDGARVGLEFLPNLLPALADRPAEAIAAGIEEALLGVAVPTDDLTLVVVKKAITGKNL